MESLEFANPFFLWLIPLAAAPILFHLFFRLKRRSRPFPSLMLFQRIHPRLNARKRLREWLILLLRALLIALAALALAHPKIFGRGKEGTLAMAIVLDNSGSMSAAGSSGQTKLEEARRAARALLATLRPRDQAGLALLADDPAVPLGRQLTSDFAGLKASLNRVGNTEASGSPARALQQAGALLRASSADRFEVHILSDLQSHEWGQAAASPLLPKNTAVVVHRIPTPPLRGADVSIASITPPRRTILGGRPASVAVALINWSGAEASVRLNWLDDAGRQSAAPVALPPHARKTIPVALAAPQPGARWAMFWIDGDAFQADNRAGLTFECQPKQAVLFLGPPKEFGLLPAALSPEGDGALSGLIPIFAEPTASLERIVREKKPMGVAVTWPELSRPPARSESLASFARSGGNVLIVPPTGAERSTAPVPDWLPLRLGTFAANASGITIVPLNPSASLFNDLRDGEGRVMLRRIRAVEYGAIAPSARGLALFGFENGQAVMVQESVGAGRVLASGLAFDARWTNLPLKPGFLAFIQNFFLQSNRSSEDFVSVPAGEPAASALPASNREIQIDSLAGDPLHWTGRRSDFTSFPRSGCFAVRDGASVRYVGVRSSDQEGRLEFLNGASIPALGKIPFSLGELKNPSALSAEHRQTARSLDLIAPLLAAALAAFFAEGWLAHPAPLRAHSRLQISKPLLT